MNRSTPVCRPMQEGNADQSLPASRLRVTDPHAGGRRNFLGGGGVLLMMKLVLIILVLAGLATGCTTKSTARLQAQNAYLAGQNAALQRQLTQQAGAISVVGPVRNATVPWVAGMTLTQALVTANYLGGGESAQIILTRQGQDGVIDPKDLVNGVQIPLEPGDIITIPPKPGEVSTLKP